MKLRPVFLILVLFLALASCGNKHSKVVDFNKIRPKSDYKYTSKDNGVDSLKYVLENLGIDSVKLQFDRVRSDSLLHFLDRFSMILDKKHPGSVFPNFSKWVLFNQNDSVQFSQWFFKDSVLRKNAFFNWMDNYGSAKQEVKMFSSVKLESSHLLYLINQKSITVIKSNQPLLRKKWEANQRYYYPKDSIVYVISQQKDKKCIWYQRTGKYSFKNISK